MNIDEDANMKTLRRCVLLLFPLALLAASVSDTVASALRARYSRISTVHLRATSEVNVTTPQGQQKTASVRFEYYASGNRYRIRSISTATIEELVPDVDVAYDGNEWQVFYPVSSELHLKRTEPSTLPVPHPNPLFLPLAFLSSRNPGHMRLGDLHDDARPEQSYDVTIAQANGVSVPAKSIHYVGGVKDLEITAEDFEIREPAGPIPLRVTVNGYEPNGTQIAHAVYSIVLLEIGKSLPAGIFKIDPSVARTVYDADAGIVLKSPDPRLLGKSLEGAQRELKPHQ